LPGFICLQLFSSFGCRKIAIFHRNFERVKTFFFFFLFESGFTVSWICVILLKFLLRKVLVFPNFQQGIHSVRKSTTNSTSFCSVVWFFSSSGGCQGI
jgi:hypothetical protein